MLLAQPRLLQGPRTTSRKQCVQVHAAKAIFQVTKRVEFGESVAVAGSSAALGEWSPERALALTWSESDLWTGSAELPSDTEILYKYIVIQGAVEHGVQWMEGDNLALNLPASAAEAVAEDSWEGAHKLDLVASGAASPAPAAVLAAAVEAAAVVEQVVAVAQEVVAAAAAEVVAAVAEEEEEVEAAAVSAVVPAVAAAAPLTQPASNILPGPLGAKSVKAVKEAVA